MSTPTATVDLSDAFLDAAAELRRQIKSADSNIAETERNLATYTKKRDEARAALNKLLTNGLPPAGAAEPKTTPTA